MNTYHDSDTLNPENFKILDNLMSFIHTRAELYLFGAGAYGKAFAHYLHEVDIKISGYIESAPNTDKCVDGNCIISLERFHEIWEKDKTGIILCVNVALYPETLGKLLLYGKDLFLLPEYFKYQVLDHYEFKHALIWHMTFHCNFACYGCSGCSPVANHGFYDYDMFLRELERFRFLYQGSGVSPTFNFTGGEPTLHPKFTDFLKSAREIFPDSMVTFYTNGLHLQQMPDSFFRDIAETRALMMITKLPIKYKWDDCLKQIRHYGVPVTFTPDTQGIDKVSWKYPLSVKKDANRTDFLLCTYMQSAYTISNGKIYSCHKPITQRRLQDKFDINFGKDNDGADIFSASLNEIEEILRKRQHFCDRCDLRGVKSLGKWMPSKRKLSEWSSDDE